MRLENLYPNFGLMSVEKQVEFVSAYRFKRQMELDSVKSVGKTKTQSVKHSKIELSDDEKALMKLLGIKAKDIETLRGAMKSEEVSSDDEEIFADNIFEGGDDE